MFKTKIVEKIKTHILENIKKSNTHFYVYLHLLQIRAIYGSNTVQPDRPQTTI
jgi:hypothetical protein